MTFAARLLFWPVEVCQWWNLEAPYSKTEAEIKAHLESVCKLEIGATHTHAQHSIGAARYMLAVTDVSTHYHWSTPLRLKSDASSCTTIHASLVTIQRLLLFLAS